MAKLKVANKNKITLSLHKIICVRFEVGEFHDNKTFYEYVIVVEIYKFKLYHGSTLAKVKKGSFLEVVDLQTPFLTYLQKYQFDFFPFKN